MTVHKVVFSPSEQQQRQWVQHRLGQVMAIAMATQQYPDWGQLLAALRDAWLERKGEAECDRIRQCYQRSSNA